LNGVFSGLSCLPIHVAEGGESLSDKEKQPPDWAFWALVVAVLQLALEVTAMAA